MQLRDAVISCWGLSMLRIGSRGPEARVKTLGLTLYYGIQCCGRMARRVFKMDVDKLVEDWMTAVVGMTIAHTKDEFDAHDARADELMMPLLRAPIKQVREFYAKFRDRLKSDPKVPFVVWMAFDCWGAVVVDKAVDDEGIKRLKRKLAADIAELVEMPVKDQIPEAIKRALMWRDPETLESVKETLQSGVKPKLVGRQSCLFLEAGRGKNKVSVML